MNSKEALKELKENAQEICKWELDRLEIIGRDLEILDILKEKLYYDNKNRVVKMKEIRKSRFNFDYEDLKEWLENDSNKNKSSNS